MWKGSGQETPFPVCLSENKRSEECATNNNIYMKQTAQQNYLDV